MAVVAKMCDMQFLKIDLETKFYPSLNVVAHYILFYTSVDLYCELLILGSIDE